MKLVALMRAARGPADVQTVADACALTLAEARMRFGSEPPGLVARLEDDAAHAVVEKLNASGVLALACPLPVRNDKERTVVHTFEVGGVGVTLTPRSGAPLIMPWSDIAVILRGARAIISREDRTEKQRQFALGTALATGGLKLSSTVRRTVHTESEDTERLLLVYDSGGRCAALYESQVVFTCLGPAMQASRAANMETVIRMIRERAPHALYDERLIRMGRRTLPFFLPNERHQQGGTATRTVTETSSSVDVLAEILWRAATQGMLS